MKFLDKFTKTIKEKRNIINFLIIFLLFNKGILLNKMT